MENRNAIVNTRSAVHAKPQAVFETGLNGHKAAVDALLKKLLRVLALILMMAVWAGLAHAEVRRPFTTRFEINEKGDVYLTGNTSLRADPTDPDASNGQNGVGTRINNNDFSMVNVDVDVNGTTFNSSSADLTIPAGGEVLWAGLYWGADTENATARIPLISAREIKCCFPQGAGIRPSFLLFRWTWTPLESDTRGLLTSPIWFECRRPAAREPIRWRMFRQ